MMIPLYRFIEISIYALLIFVPFLFLAGWPFRRHLRFSPAITNILLVVLCILQIVICLLLVFSPIGNNALYLIRTCVYAIFYFAIIDTELGKLAFTLLSFSNIGNLVTICAKYLEGILFGTMAQDHYRWSLCLCVLIIHLIVTLPLYIYIRRLYESIVQATHFAWRYLWVIPTIFYVVWYYHLFLTDQSTLAVALNFHSVLYLVVINLGAFLIYHTEVLLIKEKERAQELAQQNHLLTMQKLQYDNLQSRIHEARQARHDIRHHTHLIREYLRSGKLQELEAYLDNYTATLPDSLSLVHCQHYATNALLGFFSRQAKDLGIEMDIHVLFPEKLELPETTISVALGNLLENAIEACSQVTRSARKITVRGKAEKGFVFLTITNTFDGELRRSKSGKILSTKSANRGMGLESVVQLIQSNDGIIETEAENNIFRVSMLLPERRTSTESIETPLA